MRYRIQVRERDGRITEEETGGWTRERAEQHAQSWSAQFHTETWVVEMDGLDCVHFVHGQRMDH